MTYLWEDELTMTKKTFTPLFIALAVAALLMAGFSVWQWTAPYWMEKALVDIKPAMLNACRNAKGCQRITVEPFWNSGRARYETLVNISANKSLPNASRQELAALVREEISSAAPFIYRANLRSIVVMYQND